MLALQRSGFCVVVLTVFAFQASEQGLQLVSTVDSNLGAPAGGNGDSWAPFLSEDGRSVLFASAANNLLLASSNAPMPRGFPPALNVFLRDRVQGATKLVSMDAGGLVGGNADSLPLGVSTNARYALFQSQASNLLSAPTDTNNVSDIFVRDLVNSVTILVSANTNGAVGNGPSRDAVMTPDGRYVAFVSEASDLVPSDTNGIADVFVRDLQAGTTVLASLGAISTNAALRYGSSEAPDITPNGRFVAFSSTATNLVPGVRTSDNIYVRDLFAGTTVWASVDATAAVTTVFGAASVVSFNHAISADGGYLVYEASPPHSNKGLLLRYNLAGGLTETLYTNAAVPVAAGCQYIKSLDMTPDGRSIAFIANVGVPAGEPVTTTCVYVWDALNGDLTLASGDVNGIVPTNSTCDWPAIDAAGESVAFLSTATGLVTNLAPGDYHLYSRNVQARTTTLIDVDTNGVGSMVSAATVPSLSGNGRFVAFDCDDGNLVRGDLNRDSDVFVRDLAAFATEMISVHDPALGSATPNGPSSLTESSISPDGRFVAFASEASNLVPGDTNNCRDIFVRDMESGKIILASVGTNGTAANGYSWEPSVSADGRYVAFSSMADNLVAGDVNQDQDVFVRDVASSTTTWVSISGAIGPKNRSSYSPTLSANGRYVLFRSLANLPTGSGERWFFRDLQVTNNVVLSTQGIGPAVMSPDGRFVLYSDYSDTLLRDSLTATTTVYSSLPSLGLDLAASELVISPDGRQIALIDGPYGILWVTALTNRSSRVKPINSMLHSVSHLRWSADGERLIGTGSQIWMYDFKTATNVLVTHTFDSLTTAANGVSDSSQISADGRFVAYRSTATNLVSGMVVGTPAIYLYDAQTGVNTLLVQTPELGSSRTWSSSPVFSGDGRMLYFTSWASDLSLQDLNHNSDIFAYSFFYAVVLPPSASSSGALVTWPADSGKNYRVQFKDGLNDSAWHDLSGIITKIGNRASIQDSAAPSSQRLYRIISN